MDETYIRVHGEWKYLYRAVDKQGNTVDFLLSERRDIGTAKGGFTRAIDKQRAPEKVTVDEYAATHSAIAESKKSGMLPPRVLMRTSRYLNNLIEQDHRRVKQRIYPMHGLKRFENALVAITGIELARKIRKGQFDTSAINQQGLRAQQVREAVLAA